MLNLTISELRFIARTGNIDSYQNISEKQLEKFLIKKPTSTPRPMKCTARHLPLVLMEWLVN